MICFRLPDLLQLNPVTISRYGFALTFFFTGCFAFSQQLKFEKKLDGILLIEEGQPRFFYRTLPEKEKSQFSRANYVHPLFGLNGEILTEDFPEDHPHHHGIFWAWHQLYAIEKRIADPWLNQGITWEVVEINTEVHGQMAQLNAEVLWIQTSEDKAIIKENLSIVFNRLKEDVFTLLFGVSLTALTDGVAIGGSEDAKGYGGFSARVVLPEDISFHSADGEVMPEVGAVQAGPWMNLKGSFGSSPLDTQGIIIMGKPEKLPSYQGWILRSRESMQNMAFPGKEKLHIDKGEALSFQNQLVVHRDLSEEEIRMIYNHFLTN